MSKKLYVGNLSHAVSNLDLEGMFSAYGTVASASVITDRGTGQSKGFGFVEMGTAQEAAAAIAAMHDRDVNGRNLIVNEARPRGANTGGAFGNGGPGSGFGGGRRF